MMQHKRGIALVLCVGMILALAVSSAYILHAAGHECTGESCETCVHVAEQIALLSSFLLLGVLSSALGAILSAKREERTMCAAGSGVCRTLVGWKVRLNN